MNIFSIKVEIQKSIKREMKNAEILKFYFNFYINLVTEVSEFVNSLKLIS